jgi:capsular polysaccharide biosynthesis protein
MENNEVKNEIQIDLRRILFAVWNHIWMVLISGALIGGIALGYAYFMVTPTYSSSVQLYVNNQPENSPGFSSSQLQASQILADTYMVILESRVVLEKVNEVAGLKYTYGQLKSMVTAAAVNETDVFNVTVTATNPDHAYKLAKAIEEVLPSRIDEIVDGSSVRVVDMAVKNTKPVGPVYSRYALLGVMIGFALSLILVVLVEVTNTTVQTEDYLTTTYKDLPLLAVIPPTEGGDKYGYKNYYAAKPAAEKTSGGAK